MLQSVATRLPWAEAVRDGQKVRLEDWLEQLQQRGLDDPAWTGAPHSLGDELLVPSVLYAPAIATLLRHVDVRAIAHVTGGGLPGNVVRVLPEGADAPTWQARLEDLGQKMRRLEPVNLAAIQEFGEQSERKNYLDAQHQDLTSALDTLEAAIKKIDRETRTRFKETFDRVNSGLGELFPRLFGGGHAYLELIGEDMQLARHLHTLMARHPEFEALTQGLSIATFRYVPPDLRPRLGSEPVELYLDQLNQELLAAVEKSGQAFLSNALVGGRFDAGVLMLTDVVLTIPYIVLLGILAAFVKLDSPVFLAFVIAAVAWPTLLRAVRAQVLSLKEREYVEAARVLDLGTPHILFREVLPNMTSYIVINFVVAMTSAPATMTVSKTAIGGKELVAIVKRAIP